MKKTQLRLVLVLGAVLCGVFMAFISHKSSRESSFVEHLLAEPSWYPPYCGVCQPAMVVPGTFNGAPGYFGKTKSGLWSAAKSDVLTFSSVDGKSHVCYERSIWVMEPTCYMDENLRN